MSNRRKIRNPHHAMSGPVPAGMWVRPRPCPCGDPNAKLAPDGRLICGQGHGLDYERDTP